MSAMTTMLYKPLSVATSVAGGMLAGAVFSKVWKTLGNDEEAPEPTALDHSTKEVLTAAVLHGAVFGLVKAIVGRAAAKGYQRATGETPRA